MIEYKVDTTSFYPLAELLAKVPIFAEIELVKAITKSAIEVQNVARGQSPVRTGKLRNSIMFKVHGTTAIIQPMVDYALYVEGGTGIYGPKRAAITPKNKSVLATKTNPGWGRKSASGYFIIGKKSKGQKANPFMERTFMVTPPILEHNFGVAVKNIIQEITK